MTTESTSRRRLQRLEAYNLLVSLVNLCPGVTISEVWPLMKRHYAQPKCITTALESGVYRKAIRVERGPHRSSPLRMWPANSAERTP